MTRQYAAAAMLMAFAVAGLPAQEPPAQGLSPVLEASFDAATIKPSLRTGGWAFDPRPTGQFSATNMSLARLVSVALQTQEYRIINMPAWAEHERYDVVAKLDPQVAGRPQPSGHAPTWALALQSLLRERAGLAVHRETQTRRIYELVLARADRQLGPGIRATRTDCDALRQQAVANARAGLPSPYPPTTTTSIACGMRNSTGRIVYGGMPLPEFVFTLSAMVGRPVVDRTGLSGGFDFLLTFAPPSVTAAADATAPDLFTALQEQLGMKLEAAEGPVQVLVVDRLQRPLAD